MKVLIVLFSLVVSVTSWGQDHSKWHKGLESRIDYLVAKSGLKKSSLGVYISYEDFDADKVLYNLNSEKKFIPASLTKIVTAGAAITNYQNNGHQFSTQLLSDGRKLGSVLKGNLYLKGGGNPSFVSESLWKLVNEFVRHDITTIEGDIIIDDNLFDSVRFDPGRDPSRVDRAYDAPIGAMSFNWNSVNIYIRPGEKPGDKAKVFADPESEYIQLVNKIKTVKTGGAKRIRVSREKSIKKGRNIIRVSGSVPVNSLEKVVYKGITEPAYWSGYQLKAFLNQRGIYFKGKIKIGKVAKGAHLLAEDLSKPIDEIIKDMMKFSNNYVAEMLTKNLSVKAGYSPGNMSDGLKVIKKYIESNNINPKDYQLTNPSGLSRKNKFKPKDLIQVLNNLKNDFKNFPEYLVSLPVSGIDGTLKRRLKDQSVSGWVRAKTGRLRGVVGLAGYAKSKKYPIFSFVFIYNGSHSKLTKAQGLADRIAYALVNES